MLSRCGAALVIAGLMAAAPLQGAEYRSGDLKVVQPWSRPTPPDVGVGAVYFSITNLGRRADRLTAISSPIASSVEIHESRSAQGLMQMRAVAFVECPPGVTVKSEPGGMHVMLLGLRRPLTAGMKFPLSLSFRDSGILTVQVVVGAQE